MARSMEARARLLQWAPYLLLTVLAFALKLPFADVPPYGDEGAFYYTSRELDQVPPNLHDLYLPAESDLSPNVLYRPVPLFWYRPVHYLTMWPAAQFGFEAYRFASIALTSTIPALAASVLVAFGTRHSYAFGAGVVLAVAPYFVVWGVLTLPDTLLTMWFLAGLLAYRHGRPWLMAAAFLSAAWTKEIAVIGIAALFVFTVATRIRSGAPRTWPLEVSRREFVLAACAPLGLVPMMVALWKGGAPPGGGGAPGWGWLFEGLFGVVWLLPFVLLALVYPKTRLLAGFALVYPVFYVLYGQVLGRAVNIWYLYVPATLSIVAAAAALDAWTSAVVGTRYRRVPKIAAGIMVAIFLAMAIVPMGAAKDALIRPFTRDPADGLRDALRYESARDQDLRDALTALQLGPGQRVFVVDLYGSYVLHPVSTSGAEVWWGETRTVELFHQQLDPWSLTLEQRATYTLLSKNENALNRAVRDVYADCVTLESERFAVIEGSRCPDRKDALATRFAELTASA